MNDGRESQETLDPCFRPSTSLRTVSPSTLLGAVSLSNGLSNGRGDGSSQAETRQRHSCEILMPRPWGRGTREWIKMACVRHRKPSRGDRPVAPTTEAADSAGSRSFTGFSKEAGIQDSQGDLPPLAGLPPKSRPALVEKSEIRCNLFNDLINN